MLIDCAERFWGKAETLAEGLLGEKLKADPPSKITPKVFASRRRDKNSERLYIRRLHRFAQIFGWGCC